MMKKFAPKKIRICPGCPSNDLNLDITPQFNFVNQKTDTKKISIVNHVKTKVKGKVSSLF